MKINKVLILCVLTALLNSCLKEDDSKNPYGGKVYNLTEQDLQYFPYKVGDTLLFLHSSDAKYFYQFVVTEKSTFYTKSNYNYFETIKASCKYTAIVIQSNGDTSIYDLTPSTNVYFSIIKMKNGFNYKFVIDTYDGSSDEECFCNVVAYYPSITIKNKLFYNVYKIGNDAMYAYVTKDLGIVYFSNYDCKLIKYNNLCIEWP
jgi:hypothetical protein